MKRFVQRTSGVVALYSITSVAWGTTWYMAPNGSDTNNGLQPSSAFATLSKVHAVVNPGDTVLLVGGTYTPTTAVTFTKSGTSNAKIVIQPYNNVKPVFDCAGVTTPETWMIRLNGTASYWHIKGLEIKNYRFGGGIGINDFSSNNIIENNNIHHNGNSSEWLASGISVYGTPANNLILNNDVHHNADVDFGDADGISAGNMGSGNVFRGNRAWRNSDDGMDFFCVNDNRICGNVLIEGNWVFENGYDDNLTPLGNGEGIKLGGTRNGTAGRAGNHIVRNNLVWRNLESGIDENPNVALPVAQTSTFEVYNNTSFNNGQANYSFYHGVNHSLRNNVSYTGNIGSTNGNNLNNSWNLTTVVLSNVQFGSTDDACARRPRKPDGALPDCAFLKPVTGSSLIDKGDTRYNQPFMGSAPDLGAFETKTTSTCISTRIDMTNAVSDGGFAVLVPIRAASAPDYQGKPNQSLVTVFENGVKLSTPHALHADIRTLGNGRYSHWASDGIGINEALRFSASNNSDPRTNGRTYRYIACNCVRIDPTNVSLDSGYAWGLYSNSFGTPVDSLSAPTASRLALFENALPLGPAHSLHADIRTLGVGRFSHWLSASTQSILLSSSDNSNPKTNGRNYHYCQ